MKFLCPSAKTDGKEYRFYQLDCLFAGYPLPLASANVHEAQRR